MYRKILVPLDGSPLAECVLPHLESIVRGCSVPDVTFIRVDEPVPMPGGSIEGIAFTTKEWQRMEAQSRAAAESYLGQLLNHISYAGTNVKAEVLSGGRAAELIADYATKGGFDLIIIATHGRSGVSRWVWGSVADKILRSSCVPVLMVRSPGCVPSIS